MRKAIFFDRDGTLNTMLLEATGYRRSPRSLSELQLTPGAKETLETTRARGYLNIMISNQPELQRGLLSSAEHRMMQAHMVDLLALDDVFICYHDGADDCMCRKPRPGMILAAIDKWQIDPGASIMVGDTERDVVAGSLAGVKTAIIDGPHNHRVNADFRINQLEEILSIKL